MKSKLVLNPVAGTDAAPEYLTLINDRLRQDGDTLDIVITVAAGDATRAAEQAVRDEYDRVIVAGGDGTLNEVLNGVGAVSGGFAKVTFGLIPLGTGNDFATALGCQTTSTARFRHYSTASRPLLTSASSTIASSSTCRAAGSSPKSRTPSVLS